MASVSRMADSSAGAPFRLIVGREGGRVSSPHSTLGFEWSEYPQATRIASAVSLRRNAWETREKWGKGGGFPLALPIGARQALSVPAQRSAAPGRPFSTVVPSRTTPQRATFGAEAGVRQVRSRFLLLRAVGRSHVDVDGTGGRGIHHCCGFEAHRDQLSRAPGLGAALRFSRPTTIGLRPPSLRSRAGPDPPPNLRAVSTRSSDWWSDRRRARGPPQGRRRARARRRPWR